MLYGVLLSRNLTHLSLWLIFNGTIGNVIFERQKGNKVEKYGGNKELAVIVGILYVEEC